METIYLSRLLKLLLIFGFRAVCWWLVAGWLVVASYVTDRGVYLFIIYLFIIYLLVILAIGFNLWVFIARLMWLIGN